jgi:hypothetical protein
VEDRVDPSRDVKLVGVRVDLSHDFLLSVSEV